MATFEQVNNFIAKLSALAVAEAKKRSKWVLPSVCIAQAALETGWGTSPLMTKANAYFGIKATGWNGKVYNSATLECYDGKTYENVNACFRAYNSLQESVADYFDLITKNSRYAGAVNNKNYRSAITAIKNGGYATDPTYVDKIVNIIESYGLAKYDNIERSFNGELSGNDKRRGTDELVLYFKGLKGNGRTGTNQWGYEVQIDKNGVVLEDPHYSGNTKIPAGGKVLSGHGKAGEWIAKNIKKGYTVWFDTSAHVSVGVHRSIDTFNGIRQANFLAVYNKGSASNTNIWGWEVAVNAKGHVVKKRYGGKTPIPEGGFILSGHGSAASWINKNIKVGDTVTVSGNIVKVR